MYDDRRRRVRRIGLMGHNCSRRRQITGEELARTRWGFPQMSYTERMTEQEWSEETKRRIARIPNVKQRRWMIITQRMLERVILDTRQEMSIIARKAWAHAGRMLQTNSWVKAYREANFAPIFQTRRVKRWIKKGLVKIRK